MVSVLWSQAAYLAVHEQESQIVGSHRDGATGGFCVMPGVSLDL